MVAVRGRLAQDRTPSEEDMPFSRSNSRCCMYNFPLPSIPNWATGSSGATYPGRREGRLLKGSRGADSKMQVPLGFWENLEKASDPPRQRIQSGRAC